MTKSKYHKKKLTSAKKVKDMAAYYDDVDIEKAFDFSKAVKNKGTVKRVNMLVPHDLYVEAEKIGRMTGTGYQNALKTAIAIGLHRLMFELKNPGKIVGT
ncbi:MAG: hypothetical protein ABH857_03840 [Elusimicrobiota bacterium]